MWKEKKSICPASREGLPVVIIPESSGKMKYQQKNRSFVQSLLRLLPGALLVALSLASCKTYAVTTVTTGTEEGEQKELSKDPFFQQEPVEGELFRVLITTDSYLVGQVEGGDTILRKPDEVGDREQLEEFQKVNQIYDFKDWTFNGLLKVRLNPQSGSIEHIEYVPGENPRTWQASKYFQDDLSRFRFTFPGDEVNPTEFLVRYQWRIPRRPGLTDEEARVRALEFLRGQVRQ